MGEIMKSKKRIMLGVIIFAASVQGLVMYMALSHVEGNVLAKAENEDVKKIEKYLAEKLCEDRSNIVNKRKSELEEFVKSLKKALVLAKGSHRLNALVTLCTEAGKFRDKDLIAMLLSLVVASDEVEKVWEALEMIYGLLDPSMLLPVDRAMQSLSTPAYYSFLAGNLAGKFSDAHQVHSVGQIERLVKEKAYAKPPLLSALGYTALASPNVDVRSAALDSLSRVGDKTTIPALNENLKRETYPSLKQRTSDLLIQLKDM